MPPQNVPKVTRKNGPKTRLAPVTKTVAMLEVIAESRAAIIPISEPLSAIGGILGICRGGMLARLMPQTGEC